MQGYCHGRVEVPVGIVVDGLQVFSSRSRQCCARSVKLLTEPIFLPLELPLLSPIFKAEAVKIADFSVTLNKEIDDGKHYPL